MSDYFHLRPHLPESPFLLATDIDGTLLGDEEGEKALAQLICNFPDSISLALVTGRSISNVQELVIERHLPLPDYICGSVGTELLDCRDPQNSLGRAYASRVPSSWDPDFIYLMGEGQGIQPQAFPEGRPRLRAGFDWDGQAGTLSAFQERLSRIQGCTILESHGKFIDVYPRNLGKGKCVEFLQKNRGFPPRRVIVAGDTGNDKEMFKTKYPGILPCNALEELRLVAGQPRHYTSPYPAGRGILDGLIQLGFLRPDG